MVKSCCNATKKMKSCIREKDKKIFTLPRKFSKAKCKNPKGFTMRSSCAPYKYCSKGGTTQKKKTKKQFLFNPNNPKKSFDVYIDKNPKDTITIKYKTLQDVKDTINKLERLYKSKKYTHKRIGQVAMILRVRLKALKEKKPKEYRLAKKYCEFLKTRTKLNDNKRKLLQFK